MGKKKFFVFGDIHSFYDEFIEALNKAGYDENNKDHWLISLGDNLDRGDQSKEMYDFLMNHTERIILVKGNHEFPLMKEMLDRGYHQNHDVSNGTVKTVLDLSDTEYESIGYFGIKGLDKQKWENACKVAKNKLEPLYNRMVDYFETENYVFVHGYIPLGLEVDEEYRIKDMPEAYQPHKTVYDPNWREAQDWEWDEARWENGISKAMHGWIIPDKTIVAGHYHTSWGHAIDKYKELEKRGEEWEWSDEDYEFGDKADFSPYYCNGFIGIDACTAHSGKVNVLVLEDDLLDE